MHPPSWPLLVALLTLLVPSTALADPWTSPATEDAVEDSLVEGDIDQEDQAMGRLGGPLGSGDLHGGSWLSLVGFTKALRSGRNDIGGMVVVGLALDRIAAGPTHHLADPPHAPPPPTVEPQPPPPPRPKVVVAPRLARQCVAAALRASGLGVDDSRIDALVARARASAWFPETRMRAMRLMTDAARSTTLATTDGTTYYDAVGANLVLELRMTWRFDRLLYAGDEPGLERARLLRQEARSRLAARTLEVLFGWQRAVVDTQAAPAGSQDELDAELHASEAQATLDVLTDGWFSRREE